MNSTWVSAFVDTYTPLLNTFFSNTSDKLRELMKKEVFRVDQRQCMAGDTVPGSMSKLRGNPTVVKIDLINKRSVDQFQRLN